MFNKEQLDFSIRISETQISKIKKTPKKKNQFHCPFTFAFAMEIIYNVMYDIYACTMTGFARFIPRNIKPLFPIIMIKGNS